MAKSDTMEKADVLLRLPIKPRTPPDWREVEAISGAPTPQAAKAAIEQAQEKMGDREDPRKHYFKVGTLKGRTGLWLRIKVGDSWFSDVLLVRDWSGQAEEDDSAPLDDEIMLRHRQWLNDRIATLELLETTARDFDATERRLEAIAERLEGDVSIVTNGGGRDGDGTCSRLLARVGRDVDEAEQLVADALRLHETVVFPRYKAVFREANTRQTEVGVPPSHKKRLIDAHKNQLNDALQLYNKVRDEMSDLDNAIRTVRSQAAQVRDIVAGVMDELTAHRATAAQVNDQADRELAAIDTVWGMEPQDFLHSVEEKYGYVKGARKELDEAIDSGEPTRIATSQRGLEGHVDGMAIKLQKIEQSVAASIRHILRVQKMGSRLEAIPKRLRKDPTISAAIVEYVRKVKTSEARAKKLATDLKEARSHFNKALALAA